MGCNSDKDLSSIDYQQSDYMTAKSGVKHDPDCCQGPPKNIILVGTKLDIIQEDES